MSLPTMQGAPPQFPMQVPGQQMLRRQVSIPKPGMAPPGMPQGPQQGLDARFGGQAPPMPPPMAPGAFDARFDAGQPPPQVMGALAWLLDLLSGGQTGMGAAFKQPGPPPPPMPVGQPGQAAAIAGMDPATQGYGQQRRAMVAGRGY